MNRDSVHVGRPVGFLHRDAESRCLAWQAAVSFGRRRWRRGRQNRGAVMSMMAVAVIVLAVVLSVPVVVAVLVSMASRREDREWTLAGPARGRGQMAARRIVDFHSEGMDWLNAVGARRIRPAVPRYQSGISRKPSPDTATLPGRAVARPRIPPGAPSAWGHSPAVRAFPAACGCRRGRSGCARYSFPK
jgi:hypothetical protein